MEEATSSPYTTPSFSVSGSDLIKIMALEDLASMKPLLSRTGALAASPKATVETLSVTEIAKNSDVVLSSALNFKADESTKAQLEAYGDWYADFVLTINKDITLSADGSADGYLAGQYDNWSPYWVAVPSKKTVLKADEPLRIMATAAEQLGKKGLKYTYREVYEFVNDFDCGIYLATDFIKANPGLKATLSLRMFNPVNEAEYFVVGEEQVFDYTVPEATVETLSVTEIAKNSNVVLSSALNFKANESTDAQLETYGEWYADFVLTSNKDITMSANGSKDGYLAGQYDSWASYWVAVPTKETTLKADEPLRIMATAAEQLGKKGLKYTYREVYEFVKDFDCGIYLATDFIKANPGLKVTLSLRMFNPINEAEYLVIGEEQVFDFTLPEATVTTLDVEQIKEEAGVELSSALNFAANAVTPEQLGAYSEWYTDFAITVNKDVTFNATGEGASGYLAGQYDAYSASWLKVPSSAVSVTADDSIKIMETAAELLGKKGLKFTYKEIYDIVKDFNCGIYFNDEFLMKNADLEVKLELRLYNPANEQEYIVVGDSYAFQFEPKSVNKFVSNDNMSYELDRISGSVEVKLGEIFAPVDGANISSTDLTLSINGDNCEYIINKDDWAESTLKFTGAGQVFFVINDNNNCIDATATVTITEPEAIVKFDKKFDKDFLYRVGNKNEVSFDSLFEVKDDVKIGDVSVTIESVGGTGASGEYSNNIIKFNGTGIVKVTVTDNAYCIPTELYLEVVDAYNAITATDAADKTDDKGNIIKGSNIVLLNDIGSGFTVSDNYVVYGNGFTLNYTANGQYLNNGLRQGLVTVKDNGVLDNLRIKSSTYPRAYLYYGTTLMGDYVQGGPSSVENNRTRYHYQLSAIAASGSATISNCYVYGGRTNIFVDTGNVTIKDSVLECGTVSNIQVQSTSEYTVTLEDVTTIQYQNNPTYGADDADKAKIMLGFGILMGPESTSYPNIVLNGDFKQYNWVSAEDAEAASDKVVKAGIDAAVKATEYNHTIDGVQKSNLGIVYMSKVEPEPQITNNTGLPYKLGTIKISISGNTAEGQVYSLQGATDTQIYSNYENADKTTVQGDYFVDSSFVFDLGDQGISYEGGSDERYLYGDKNGVFALYKDGESPLTLDITKIARVIKYSGNEYLVNASCKDSTGKQLTTNNGVITLEAQGDYTLTFTVTDNIFFDNMGNPIEKSVERTFIVSLNLTVKEADIKNAVVDITKTSLDGVYTTVNLTDYKLRIGFPDCISVTDYDNKGNGTTVDLTKNIASATLTPSSVNVFETASTITVTYTDGRVLTVNLSKISGSSPGTKTATVNTSGGLYFITDGALDNKPTESKNQNKCTITSVSYKGNNGSTITNDTDVAVTWELGSSCLSEGTLITLADGSKRAVEDLRKGDMVMSYDHVNGKLTSENVIIVVKTATDFYYKNTFVFDDDSKLETINGHGIYDLDLNKYVNIDHENYNEFIGHNFVAVDTEGKLGTKKLVDVICEIGSGYKYDIVTDGTLNYVAEDTLSVTHVLVDVINSFDFADDMTYDTEKMASDIETYGLYSYDEWEDYCDISVFEEYNIPVMKVGISKGMYTKEYIIGLINTYVLDESVQIID